MYILKKQSKRRCKPEYHTKMVFEHFENGGDIPPQFVHEKETVSDKYGSGRVFRAGSEFLKR